MSQTRTITYYSYTCGDCGTPKHRTTYIGHCAICNRNLCFSCDRTTVCSVCSGKMNDKQKKAMKKVITRTRMLTILVAYISAMFIVIGLLPWGVDLIMSGLIAMVIIGAVLLGFFTPILHFLLLKQVQRNRLGKLFTGK